MNMESMFAFFQPCYITLYKYTVVGFFKNNFSGYSFFLIFQDSNCLLMLKKKKAWWSKNNCFRTNIRKSKSLCLLCLHYSQINSLQFCSITPKSYHEIQITRFVNEKLMKNEAVRFLSLKIEVLNFHGTTWYNQCIEWNICRCDPFENPQILWKRNKFIFYGNHNQV